MRKLRNMYGSAIATETFGAKFFANDARPSVIMEVPAKMSESAQQSLTHSLYEKFSGAENKWKVLVLEQGAKMHMVQMPLDDAQFLGLRGLDNSLICAAFGVPPHMVGLTEKVTSFGSGLTDLTLGFSKFTILPWCLKMELEYRRKLFTDGRHFAKHSLAGLERGDLKTRNDAYQLAVNNGLLTIDEVRELEDLPPHAGGIGARPLVPVNLQRLDQVGTTPPKEGETKP